MMQTDFDFSAFYSENIEEFRLIPFIAAAVLGVFRCLLQF